MDSQKNFFSSERGTKVLTLLAIVLIVFVAGKAVAEWKSVPYAGGDYSSMSTISVNGKGEVYVVPDVAMFSFTVEQESLVIANAQNEVTERTKAIIEYLKKAGVAEKDIKTTNYNIYPRYEYDNRYIAGYYPTPSGKQTLAAYVVSQSIEVKVRTIADAGKLVSGVGELGATGMSGLTFTVDDDEAVMNEAREKAIEDAKTRAKELASQLGVRLIRITSYSDSGYYPPMYYAKGAALGMGGDAMAVAEAQLPAGENKYESNITITYEVR